MSRWRAVVRVGLGVAYTAAGVLHLTAPRPFLRIIPDWVPHAELVIAFTGLAELAGAAALVQPWSRPLRRAGGIGLALYALCVWPANVNHMIIDLTTGTGLPLWYHAPRMVLQPVLIWAALWAGEVVRRPAA